MVVGAVVTIVALVVEVKVVKVLEVIVSQYENQLIFLLKKSLRIVH